MKLFKVSIIFTIFFLLSIKETFADKIEKLNLCENKIQNIAMQTDIPKGLLVGIGKAEAIRKIKNKFVIWPWTINHAGRSMFFDTKKQMKNYVYKNLKKTILILMLVVCRLISNGIKIILRKYPICLRLILMFHMQLHF